MTSDQRQELDKVRWRLDRMCRRRAQVALSTEEEDQYRQLTQLEAHLLSAA